MKFCKIETDRPSKENWSTRILLVTSLLCVGFTTQGCFLFNASDSSDDSSKEDIDEGYGADFGEMELFSEAMRSYEEERYSISRNLFDKIIGKYPSSPLSVFAELKIADSVFYADKYIESIPFYKEFMRVHTSHEAIPYAEYQIAQAYFHAYRGISHDVTPLKEAKKSFSNVIEKYPESTWSVFADEQILECDKLLFSSEMNVIEFYEKKGLQTAARSRLETAKSTFSHLEQLDSVPVDSTDQYPENTVLLNADETSMLNEIFKEENNGVPTVVFEEPIQKHPDENDISEKKIENNFSIENYDFLRSISCDSNEYISRLVLYFRTKPYLYSSRQNHPSVETNSKNYENIILIHNNAALNFNNHDLQPTESDGSILRELESCGSSLDQIKVNEIIMNPLNDFSGPAGFVHIALSSKKERKVKMLSFSEPERIIIVFE